MSLSNAERQARYRKSRPFAGPDGNGERQLNTWLSTGAWLALGRLAKHYAVTKREMLERLLMEENERVTRGMNEEQFAEYLG